MQQMKTFKITIITELRLPDDFELAKDPRDDDLCLKRNTRLFQPSIHWLEQDTGGWTSADDELQNELGDAAIHEDFLTQTYEIEEMTPQNPVQ
jgi:hypothetical protein